MPTSLWIGDHIIPSVEGVQQGDLLGPLFFCLTLNEPLKRIHAELVTEYLDDIGIGDTVERLIEHVRLLESATGAIGLNYVKCEVLDLEESQRTLWETSGLIFLIRKIDEASL